MTRNIPAERNRRALIKENRFSFMTFSKSLTNTIGHESRQCHRIEDRRENYPTMTTSHASTLARKSFFRNQPPPPPSVATRCTFFAKLYLTKSQHTDRNLGCVLSHSFLSQTAYQTCSIKENPRKSTLAEEPRTRTQN